MKPFSIEILTSEGWKFYDSAESESLAVAHFFLIGKHGAWNGHVRVVFDDRVIISTLNPGIRTLHENSASG